MSSSDIQPPSEETIVYGTDNAANDVRNIQDAVDRYDLVRLVGTFSFLNGETGTPRTVIKILRSVQILGEGTTRPLIKDGQRPFHISKGASVSINNLHFKDSRGQAIYVEAAENLNVYGCKFETVVPVTGMTTIAIAAAAASGILSILNNDITVGGTSAVATNGILAVAPRSTNIDISNNTIQNITAHGIDIRNAPGDVRIIGNTIVPGRTARSGSSSEFVDGIRCAGTGRFVVHNNSITIEFENAAAIRLAGTTGANVSGNAIEMLLVNPAGAQSGGIQVQGTCVDTRVEDNQIYGGARVALAAIHSDFALDRPTGTSGDPVSTSFERNDHLTFVEAFADIEVGAGAMNTRIVAPVRTVLPQQPVGSEAVLTKTGAGVAAAAVRRPAPQTIEGTVSDRGAGTSITGNYTLLT